MSTFMSISVRSGEVPGGPNKNEVNCSMAFEYGHCTVSTIGA